MVIKHPKRDPSADKKEIKCTSLKKNASNGPKGLCFLPQKNVFKLSSVPKESRQSSTQLCGMEKPLDLEHQIRKKIVELVDKEETLVDLYKKAAEVAKKREEELKTKTALLIQQLEKDKNLMKSLKLVR